MAVARRRLQACGDVYLRTPLEGRACRQNCRSGFAPFWPHADTGVGNPIASSPEKGARFLEAVAARIGSFLIELAATDPATLYDNESSTTDQSKAER